MKLSWALTTSWLISRVPESAGQYSGLTYTYGFPSQSNSIVGPDSSCSDFYNTPEYGYDFGDCCECDCIDGDILICGPYFNCVDPSSACYEGPAPTPSSDSDRLCAAEVDACAADSTCLACILESNDNYDGCLPDAGYDVFTAPCSDVKDVVCCQMGDLLSCRSNALLGAFWDCVEEDVGCPLDTSSTCSEDSVEPSPSPVTPLTPAPVTPLTSAPVTPLTPAPVTPLTSAPVTPLTPAPVTPLTPAPVTPVSGPSPETDAPEAENTTILTPEPDTPLVTSTEAPAAGARDLDVTPSPLSDNAAAGEDTAGVAGRESPGMRGLVSIGLGVLVGMAALV